MIRVIFAVVALAGLLRHARSASNCETPAVDRTVEEGATGIEAVLATIERITKSGIFDDDREFLRRMAAVETGDGIRFEPGQGGIWRVDLRVFSDVNNYMKTTPLPLVNKEIEERLCFRWTNEVTGYLTLDAPLYSTLTVLIRLISLDIKIEDHNQADIWRTNFNMDGDINLFDREVNSILARGKSIYKPVSISYVYVCYTAEAAARKCEIPGVDMIFVMDKSQSIGRDSFELMKELAINITNEFEIGPEDTQVGWINFHKSARVVFNLNEHNNRISLQEAIQAVPYRNGGTNISEGLLALHDHGFNESAGDRNSFDIPEVAIVVTDGQSALGPIQSAATVLRENRNVNVFAIGVGPNVERVQLEAIALAGITNDSSHVYQVRGFIENELAILQETIKARCLLW